MTLRGLTPYQMQLILVMKVLVVLLEVCGIGGTNLKKIYFLNIHPPTPSIESIKLTKLMA